MLQGELLERARALDDRQRWQLVEELDPDISHFEFFLVRPPLPAAPADDGTLLGMAAERNRCLWGWPSCSLFGPDLQPLNLEDGDLALLLALEQAPAGTTLAALELVMPAAERLERSLRLRRLGVLLPVAPGTTG